MKQEITDRIKLLIKLSGQSVNSYAKSIGIFPQSLYKWIKNEREPNIELLQKILKANPDISADWLLMGKGEMKKQDLSFFKKQIEIKDEQIKILLGQLK